MIPDMIGQQLVDSELVHAELTTDNVSFSPRIKAGSALVEVLFFFFLNIFMQV